VSESENPAIDAPEVKEHRPHTNQDWWPNQLDLQVLCGRCSLTSGASMAGFSLSDTFGPSPCRGGLVHWFLWAAAQSGHVPQ